MSALCSADCPLSTQDSRLTSREISWLLVPSAEAHAAYSQCVQPRSPNLLSCFYQSSGLKTTAAAFPSGDVPACDKNSTVTVR